MTWAAISADNPWQFDDGGIRGGTDHHYKTVPLEQLCSMPVADLAARDAYLFLWVPSAFMIEGDGARCCRAWGFEPKQMGTWVKPTIGTGHHLRNRTEHYIVATRGKPKPLSRGVPNCHYWPRATHSAKPPEFYRQVVEKLARGPYLELFAREPRSGWATWGNEGVGGIALPKLDAALR